MIIKLTEDENLRNFNRFNDGKLKHSTEYSNAYVYEDKKRSYIKISSRRIVNNMNLTNGFWGTGSKDFAAIIGINLDTFIGIKF